MTDEYIDDMLEFVVPLNEPVRMVSMDLLRGAYVEAVKEYEIGASFYGVDTSN